MRTVPASPDLVPFLLSRMGAERVEKLAGRVGDPFMHMVSNIALSALTWAGVDDAGVVNMGGVRPVPNDKRAGYVWQIITDGVHKNKRAYLVQGREMMVRGLLRYERLLTVVESDYTAALRHCQRNGWVVSDPQQINGMVAHVCEARR